VVKVIHCSRPRSWDETCGNRSRPRSHCSGSLTSSRYQATAAAAFSAASACRSMRLGVTSSSASGPTARREHEAGKTKSQPALNMRPAHGPMAEGTHNGNFAGIWARQTGSGTCSACRTIDTRLDPTSRLLQSRITAEPVGRQAAGAQVFDPHRNRQRPNCRLMLSIVPPTTNNCISP
jgi:hypothetical protein